MVDDRLRRLRALDTPAARLSVPYELAALPEPFDIARRRYDLVTQQGRDRLDRDLGLEQGAAQQAVAFLDEGEILRAELVHAAHGDSDPGHIDPRNMKRWLRHANGVLNSGEARMLALRQRALEDPEV